MPRDIHEDQVRGRTGRIVWTGLALLAVAAVGLGVSRGGLAPQMATSAAAAPHFATQAAHGGRSSSDGEITEASLPEAVVIVPPKRSSERRHEALVLPELSSSWLGAPAISARVVTTFAEPGQHVQRKTIQRTRDRLHVAFEKRATEWLFARNPVDTRRMSATLIDHTRKRLIEYDESELRSGGLGRGWADVVALGLAPEQLHALQPTGRRRKHAGMTFDERRAPGALGHVREAWWSDEAVLPLRIVIEDEHGLRTIAVEDVRRLVDSALLADPRQRFPNYTVVDVADDREQRHEH